MQDSNQQSVSSFSEGLGIPRFPGLLVSVRDLAEAQLCLGGAVDILDLKEPNHGALGPVDVKTMEAVSSWVAARSAAKPPKLSFAAGELVEWDHSRWPRLIDCYDRELVGKFQFAKIGLAHATTLSNWQASWFQFFDALPKSIQPVAVGYFDHGSCSAPSIDEVVEFAVETNSIQTVLLDTFGKKQDLFHWIDDQQLAAVIDKCRRAGVRVVVAGSVKASNLERVKSLCPEFVGVRGVICRGGRSTTVDESLLNDFRAKLRQNMSPER